jgi:putative NIF3 family GTP cyclohydrolase 1 type 2
MTATELNAWLRALHVVPEPSVDRLIVGAPETNVRGIAVVWLPTWAALREAATHGCNVVIAHEPTFFTHHDLDGFDAAFADIPPHAKAELIAARDAKRRWIEEQRMVVIRCHDVLDAMPGGVVDCLAAGLGFSRSDYEREWQRFRVVRLPAPTRAAAVAQQLATRFAAIGSPGIAFHGDPERIVRTLGLGTGYGADLWRFVELGADMAVSIHDRVKTWTEGAWCGDAGFPLAIIDHGTSEEWGVRRLADIVCAKFPDVPVRLLAQGCSFRWFSPSPHPK